MLRGQNKLNIYNTKDNNPNLKTETNDLKLLFNHQKAQLQNHSPAIPLKKQYI